jgi:hypothetical protein
MKASTHRWSHKVTRESNALDLEPGVFRQSDPKAIARSLKKSAETSRRRKTTPFQSAMSMLNFYLNRAGSRLPSRRRSKLVQTKAALRDLFQKQRS